MTDSATSLLPPEVILFDIDGTLTTSDFEIIKDLFAEILTGDYVPEAYPEAAEMTWAHRDMKRGGGYITGRPHWLRSVSREGLSNTCTCTSWIWSSMASRLGK